MQINAHINDDCVCIHAYTCVHVTDEQADHRQVICSELFPVEVKNWGGGKGGKNS